MAVWATSDGVTRFEVDGNEVYRDSDDHWENGVCRLLGLEPAGDGRRWVEATAVHATEIAGTPRVRDLPIAGACAAIRAGWCDVRPSPPTDALRLDAAAPAPVLEVKPDVVYAHALPLSPSNAVVGCVERGLAWLVDRVTLRPPARSVIYEEEYFEGTQQGLGYGRYLDQQAWRLEKARRFVRQVDAVMRLVSATSPVRPRVLDVGCGYGFFRKAADEAGWRHDGIEVSRFAVEACRELFGFDSRVGALQTMSDERVAPYDVVTMWDVVEHVPDPVLELQRARDLLLDDGLLFVRTPSIAALEVSVFGPWYHSFKAEHLWYFGPRGLVDVLGMAGFEVVFLSTDSHLLSGFLGTKVAGEARQLRGSDMFVAARPAT